MILFRMNLEKFQQTRFVSRQNLGRHTRSPLLISDRTVSSEYASDIHEVVKDKRKIKDTIPVHIRRGYQILESIFFPKKKFL